MQVETVLCPNCNSNILQKCLMIHEIACYKSMNKGKHEKGFFSKIFLQEKKEKKWEDDEMIPCLECGESVPFSMFSLHQEQCVGNQLTKCYQCQILFPSFLFEEHMQVCTGPKYQPPPPVNNFQINNNKKVEIQPKVNNHSQNNFVFKIPEIFNPQVQPMMDEESDYQEDELLNEMIATLARSQIQKQKLGEGPLTTQQLKKLQKIKLESVEECSICCCEMIKKTYHIKLNCNHTFHKRCITSWLGKNPLCPMCRQHALKQ